MTANVATFQDVRIKLNAQAMLKYISEKRHNRSESAILLRASSVSATGSGELLRPTVLDKNTEDGSELLRADIQSEEMPAITDDAAQSNRNAPSSLPASQVQRLQYNANTSPTQRQI